MFLQINNLEKFYGEKDNRVQVLKGLSTGNRQNRYDKRSKKRGD